MSESSRHLERFLQQHICNENQTHTKIPNKFKHVPGGKFHIPNEELSEFYKLYYNAVFRDSREYHITELQHRDKEYAPILIDLDLKYSHDVDVRKHEDSDIYAIIDVYLTALKELLIFDTQSFNIFVFQKPNVNRLDDGSYTKDGIHIVIGIGMDHTTQSILRDKVIRAIDDYIDLPIVNDWEQVVDSTISKGSTGWQLYGSNKPDHERYLLYKWFEVAYNMKDCEFEYEPDGYEGDSFPLRERFEELCARYDKNPTFELKEEAVTLYENRLKASSKPKGMKRSKAVRSARSRNGTDLITPDQLQTERELDHAIQDLFDDLPIYEYGLKETHRYVMILPEKYYTDRNEWICVGWALRNTSNLLFMSWVKFSSQWNRFTFDDVSTLYDIWTNMETGERCYTHLSIMHWARDYWNGRQDIEPGENKYQLIYNESLECYIDESIREPNDYNVAKVCQQMFKSKYVCSQIKANEWYAFIKHRWKMMDNAYLLGLAISQELYQEYNKIQNDCIEKMSLLQDTNPDVYNRESKKAMVLIKITQMLKNTDQKSRIIKQARELFYDESFKMNADSNPYLLGFTNGVVDFERCEFRKGHSKDYITMSTRNKYIPTEKLDPTIVAQINDFMDKLFPNKQLLSYMWDVLSASLMGTNKNQTFNNFLGKGSNGKSILMKLMELCMGDYFGILPIGILTGKRSTAGSASPELAALRGKRIALVNEPSDSDNRIGDNTINEGVMKELTGGDTINPRALYKENESYTPQFTLLVATNSLFNINATDDGTWRRIRVVNFESKFVDKINPNDKENKYQYLKDRELEDKLKLWKEAFISMLVERAFKNKGLVVDCSHVLSAKDEYRMTQDHIMDFINNKLVVEDNAYVKKRELKDEYEDWYKLNYDKKMSGTKKLYDQMDKHFGKPVGGKWMNVSIMHDNDEEYQDPL